MLNRDMRGLDFQVTLMPTVEEGKTPQTSTHIVISFQFPQERWAQNTPLKIKIQWFTSTIKLTRLKHPFLSLRTPSFL
jgi:hypothetical protein